MCIKAKLFLEQTYIFFPLLCGELALPQLGITLHLSSQNPVPVDYISQMMAPTVKVLVSIAPLRHYHLLSSLRFVLSQPQLRA